MLTNESLIEYTSATDERQVLGWQHVSFSENDHIQEWQRVSFNANDHFQEWQHVSFNEYTSVVDERSYSRVVASVNTHVLYK